MLFRSPGAVAGNVVAVTFGGLVQPAAARSARGNDPAGPAGAAAAGSPRRAPLRPATGESAMRRLLQPVFALLALFAPAYGFLGIALVSREVQAKLSRWPPSPPAPGSR